MAAGPSPGSEEPLLADARDHAEVHRFLGDFWEWTGMLQRKTAAARTWRVRFKKPPSISRLAPGFYSESQADKHQSSSYDV